jgi:hypothetical protein
LPANAYTDLKAALVDPDHVFKEAPFTVEIVDAMRQVPRADVPDMPDRIVAATAVYFGVPVISRDGRIRASRISEAGSGDRFGVACASTTLRSRDSSSTAAYSTSFNVHRFVGGSS